jgi:hypothetical protein
MHLRKRQLGATPVFAFFLNRPFGCQKHHFKLKYESIFSLNLQLPGVHRGPTLFPQKDKGLKAAYNQLNSQFKL